MIQIDYNNNNNLSEAGLAILKDRYLLDGENDPQEAFARAAIAFSDDEEMAQRIYGYASKLWFMYATPVLSNAPVRVSWGPNDEARSNFEPHHFIKPRGMPISCFLSYIGDSLASIGDHWVESMYLASSGGGIGGHWMDVRSNGSATSRGSASNGIIPFIKVVDSEMSAVSQGKTRRGSYAAWLDISHPEIEEFLVVRKPAGGDINRKALNIHHGVVIGDDFMELIARCQFNPDCCDDWPLIDPNSGKVTKVVSAKKLWETILETRMQTGEPYVAFRDTINRAVPQPLLDLGLFVRASNLCAEITLPTTETRTAVCCLSSVNLAKFDEWKDDPLFIEDLIRFLDNVLSFFIANAPEGMWRAKNSAMHERSLGLGAMGFHTYLMQKGIPWESALATSTNKRVFKHLHERATEASFKLGTILGEAPDMVGTGMRNAHLLAIAPNASSSLICGSVSPSVEPLRANAFLQKTLTGSFTIKNKVLEDILRQVAEQRYDNLEERQEWLNKQWRSIITNRGSVQHLDYLPDAEKEVFKTAMELDQRWVVDLAADRQEFICQSQSLNLFLPPDVSVVELHGLHMRAWQQGVKTLYYLRSEAIKRAETVSTTIERRNLYHFTEETCLSCEG